MSGASDILTVEQIRGQLERQLWKARGLLDKIGEGDWTPKDQALSDLVEWAAIYLMVSRPPP